MAHSSTFDIVSCYNALLRDDHNITPPIAAIESLITLLATSSLTTISETLDLLSTHSQKLLSSQQNPIPLSAGTELFHRYLITTFQQRHSSLANASFEAVKRHIITQSSLFVKRANEARLKIAQHALPFIRDETTIVTFGYSRVVASILTAAAEADRTFNVVFIAPATSPSPSSTSDQSHLQDTISTLTSLGITTTTIPLHALPLALSSLDPGHQPQILLGVTAVLENGGVISDIGAHTIAIIARATNTPLYVCVESYKFTRNFPLGNTPTDLKRMGVKQDVLGFRRPGDDNESADAMPAKALEHEGSDYFGTSQGEKAKERKKGGGGAMIEITPPELISALITENGIMTTNAVSEELIKLWF